MSDGSDRSAPWRLWASMWRAKDAKYCGENAPPDGVSFEKEKNDAKKNKILMSIYMNFF